MERPYLQVPYVGASGYASLPYVGSSTLASLPYTGYKGEIMYALGETQYALGGYGGLGGLGGPFDNIVSAAKDAAPGVVSNLVQTGINQITGGGGQQPAQPPTQSYAPSYAPVRSSGSKKWLYLGGGVAVLAGAAYFLLIRK